MSEVSLTPHERARRIASAILQRVNATETQASIATALGVSPATIQRMLADHLETFAGIMAHVALKAVPVEYQCVSGETYAFLTSTHQRVMAQAPHLIWDTKA